MIRYMKIPILICPRSLEELQQVAGAAASEEQLTLLWR